MSSRQKRGKRSSLDIYSDGHECNRTSCPSVLTASRTHVPKDVPKAILGTCPAPCVLREGTGAVLSTATWKSLKPSEDQTRDRAAGHCHELAPGKVPSFLWETETQHPEREGAGRVKQGQAAGDC